MVGCTSSRSMSARPGCCAIGIEGAYRILARNLRLPTPERYIDWEDVDPVETSIASIRLRAARRLTELHPADLATIIDQLAPRDRAGVLAALDDEAVADAIEEMEPTPRSRCSRPPSARPTSSRRCRPTMRPTSWRTSPTTREELLALMEKDEAEELGASSPTPRNPPAG